MPQAGQLGFASCSMASLLCLQDEMYQRAHTQFWDSVEKVTDWDTFMKAINSRHMALAPWCALLHCTSQAVYQDLTASLLAFTAGRQGPAATSHSLPLLAVPSFGNVHALLAP